MNHQSQIRSKIHFAEDIDKEISIWKKGKNVVFTNGCFDILHKGHIDYLSKAASLGDFLIVGLNSDLSVKSLNKGNERPLQDESSRAMIMASLQFVDKVVIFSENNPQKLIEKILPNTLVKGSDYSISEIVGSDIVLKNGGEVKTIDFLDGYSTSAIVQKAIKNH